MRAIQEDDEVNTLDLVQIGSFSASCYLSLYPSLWKHPPTFPSRLSILSVVFLLYPVGFLYSLWRVPTWPCARMFTTVFCLLCGFGSWLCWSKEALASDHSMECALLVTNCSGDDFSIWVVSSSLSFCKWSQLWFICLWISDELWGWLGGGVEEKCCWKWYIFLCLWTQEQAKVWLSNFGQKNRLTSCHGRMWF